MLVGNANPETLALGAATLSNFDVEPVVLEDVETLMMISELSCEGMESLLPPGLHPTLPPIGTWMVQRIAKSPWGAFHLAQFRVECRSGLRPRGFLRAGVIDNEAACESLAKGWGYRLSLGEIRFERGYDRSRAVVYRDGKEIFDGMLDNPQLLRNSDVFYASNVNLAHTPNGLRLVQVDPAWEVTRAERGKFFLREFDAAGWNCDAAVPTYSVTSTLTVGRVTVPSLRFVCRPDVLAFEGAERVG